MHESSDVVSGMANGPCWGLLGCRELSPSLGNLVQSILRRWGWYHERICGKDGTELQGWYRVARMVQKAGASDTTVLVRHLKSEFSCTFLTNRLKL